MSIKKVITKEIANNIFDSSEYTEIEDEAAKALANQCDVLHLDGLTSLR